MFISGSAGTGKTSLINGLKRYIFKPMMSFGTTGSSAIAINGNTIHSFFKFDFQAINTLEEFDISTLKKLVETTVEKRYNAEYRKLINYINLIIIDEVSMLRADILDMIDLTLKTVRKNTKSFGGVQMIFIGDLFQLPPILGYNKKTKLKYLKSYKSSFFFDSNVFSNLNKKEDLIYHELKRIYRQADDPRYLTFLQNLRKGILLADDHSYINQCWQNDFDFISNHKAYTMLTNTRKKVDEMNQICYDLVQGDEYIYTGSVKHDFDLNANDYLPPEKLKIKIGLRVMVIKNDSSLSKKYYNGLLGKVVKCSSETVTIVTNDDELIEIGNETWKDEKYQVNEKTKAIEIVDYETNDTPSYTQLPLTYAYAMTIHKSQGLTLDNVFLSYQAHNNEQYQSFLLYTALTRCRSIKNLVIDKTIHQHYFNNDSGQDQVDAFYTSLKKSKYTHSRFIDLKNEFSSDILNTIFRLDEHAFLNEALLDMEIAACYLRTDELQDNLTQIKILNTFYETILPTFNQMLSKLQPCLHPPYNLNQINSILKTNIIELYNVIEDATMQFNTTGSDNKKVANRINIFKNFLNDYHQLLPRLSNGFSLNSYLHIDDQAWLDKLSYEIN